MACVPLDAEGFADYRACFAALGLAESLRLGAALTVSSEPTSLHLFLDARCRAELEGFFAGRADVVVHAVHEAFAAEAETREGPQVHAGSLGRPPTSHWFSANCASFFYCTVE